MKSQSVLHFALAQIVQIRSPMLILREVVGHMFREQNVSGVAAIHHTLSNVDSCSGDV